MKASERIALYLLLLFILATILTTSDLPKIVHVMILIPFGFCGGIFIGPFWKENRK